jgi:hypothetical protein
VTPVVLVSVLIALVLAGAAGYVALRLSTGRGGGAATVMAFYLLAITFSIVAIFSLTFIRKTVGG